MKAVLIAGVAGLVSAVCAGADITWKGEGETTAWSDGSNWEGGVAPALGDTAVIPTGKTAGMASADISYVSATETKLAGISLPAADGGLYIKNTTSVTLSVPLSGIGPVEIDNGGSVSLTLGADNGNYSGPMTIRKSEVRTDYTHLNAFGKNNVVTNIVEAGTASQHVYFFKGGDYYNTWQIVGLPAWSTTQSFYTYYAVVFNKPV